MQTASEKMNMCRVVSYLPAMLVEELDREARRSGGIARTDVMRRWLEAVARSLRDQPGPART